MDKVTISQQGRAIVEACETKVVLQNKAETLNTEARVLLARLKQISDEQHTILQNISDLDSKIMFLSTQL